MTDHRRSLGALGEQYAAEHLERLGYTILDRNHRSRFGELDLVAAPDDGSAIVFVEVKTRRSDDAAADPFLSIHRAKQVQVRRLAVGWLRSTTGRPYAPDLRFDAIGVVLDPTGRLVRLDHLEAAF